LKNSGNVKCPVFRFDVKELFEKEKKMIKYFISLLFLLNLSSFSSLKNHISHQCVSKESLYCSDNYFLCPPGYIDGCLAGETDYHKCVLKHEGPSCEMAINLKCPENFHDGCESNSTQTHECIPQKGLACDEILPYFCPIGFEDACSK
jgi:hypothetical protein